MLKKIVNFVLFVLLVLLVERGYCLNLDKVKVYFLAGDYDSAALEGEKMLVGSANTSDLDELYYILGLSYLKENNFLRASDIFEIILKEFRDTKFKEEAQLGLGDAYFLRNDFSKAEVRYKELINNNPNTKLKAQAYYRLSHIEFKKGDTHAAKEYLDKLKIDFPLNAELKLNQDLSLITDYSSGLYYTVQVGSFAKSTNAGNLCDKLIQKGYDAYVEEIGLKDDKHYRVKVGKLKSRQEAVQLENKLSQEGYPTKICP